VEYKHFINLELKRICSEPVLAESVFNLADVPIGEPTHIKPELLDESILNNYKDFLIQEEINVYKSDTGPVFQQVKRREVPSSIDKDVIPITVQPRLTAGAFPLDAQRIAFQNLVKLRCTDENSLSNFKSG